MDVHLFGKRLLWLAVVFTIIGLSHGNVDSSSPQNVTDAFSSEEEMLTKSERYRRLVPYMTFYLAQVVPQVYIQSTGAAQQYVPIVTVNNKVETQPQQLQHSALVRYPVYLMPYLVGNSQQGYKRVHIYSNAPIPISYSPYTYAPQRPAEIPKLIAQNYAAISKQTNTKVPEVQTFPGPPSYSYNTEQYVKPIYQTDSLKSSQYKTTPSQLTALEENIQPSYPIKQTPSILAYPKMHIYNYVLHPQPKQRPSIKLVNNDDIVSITPSHEIELTEKTTTRLHKPSQIISQIAPSTYHETTENIADILAEYPVTKTFSSKVAPSNLGSTFQTLSQIIKLLQRTKPLPQTPQVNIKYNAAEDDDKTLNTEEENEYVQNFPALPSEGSTPGRPGLDYPIYEEIPETKFSCKEQRYKGFFGDPETNCQVWHYCDLNGGQASFLCPNGTIFSQVALTCDWWFNVKCASTAQLYVLNERLYKYILPVKPSFPEDFAGPIVDQYLSLKFHELEAKRKNSTTKSHSKPKEANAPKT